MIYPFKDNEYPKMPFQNSYKKVQFFTTRPIPCPYIKGNTEKQIVTTLSGTRDTNALHTHLSQAGFRRSYQVAYRPDCGVCQACIPVRVQCKYFKMTKSQKRVWNKTSVSDVIPLPPVAVKEHFDLFILYQKVRHAEDLMARMSFEAYQEMIESTPVQTRLFEFRTIHGTLVGISLTDVLHDGVSMVYSFYDPSFYKESPGTFMILWHILQTQSLSSRQPYLYLGYWVDASTKMSYKKNFKPLETLVNGNWRLLNS